MRLHAHDIHSIQRISICCLHAHGTDSHSTTTPHLRFLHAHDTACHLFVSCLFVFTPPPYVPACSRPATNTHIHFQYSTQPEPCSLPWTYYLLYYLLFTTRPCHLTKHHMIVSFILFVSHVHYRLVTYSFREHVL